MSNFYKSRLITTFHPITVLGSSRLNGSENAAVIYNNNIYFFSYEFLTPSTVHLFKWNGIGSYSEIATYSGFNGKESHLLVFNNDLYFAAVASNSINLRKLNSNGTYTEKETLTPGFSFTYATFVVYGNKIHTFINSNSQKGAHYSFNGTSWSQESSSGSYFSEDPNPVVWNNKIYVFGTQRVSNSSTGLRIYCWDGTNWEAFYSKTAYNSVDSTDASTSFHRVYFRNADGTFPSSPNLNALSSNLGGMCVFNDELYLFSNNSKLLKYDHTYGDFVIQNDSYPQESDVGSGDNKYRCNTLISYKNRIYSIGGFYSTSGGTLKYPNIIYRYDPSTKEWETE